MPRLDEKSAKVEVLATGLPASPGAAVGQIVFTADAAVEWWRPANDYNKKYKDEIDSGRREPRNANFILVRAETTPEDIHGMEVAAGILTSRGGMTSHAAVVTRGMGKCCVAGAGDIEINDKSREMKVKGEIFKEGDWLSLDGTTGRVIKGKLNTIPPNADDPELKKFMQWAEPHRTMKVRANADIPRDAIQARAFGAEGIGLCRTEHMFFGEEKIPHMRAMILADNEKDRRTALKKLLPMQRADFAGVFKAMDGLPVTIRTLDPPLHEFLPRREDLMVDIATLPYADAKREERTGEAIFRLRRERCRRSEEAFADAAGPGRGAVARVSIPCSDIADAGWALRIPRLPRCRRAPSSRLRSIARRRASRCCLR